MPDITNLYSWSPFSGGRMPTGETGQTQIPMYLQRPEVEKTASPIGTPTEEPLRYERPSIWRWLGEVGTLGVVPFWNRQLAKIKIQQQQDVNRIALLTKFDSKDLDDPDFESNINKLGIPDALARQLGITKKDALESIPNIISQPQTLRDILTPPTQPPTEQPQTVYDQAAGQVGVTEPTDVTGDAVPWYGDVPKEVLNAPVDSPIAQEFLEKTGQIWGQKAIEHHMEQRRYVQHLKDTDQTPEEFTKTDFREYEAELGKRTPSDVVYWQDPKTGQIKPIPKGEAPPTGWGKPTTVKTGMTQLEIYARAADVDIEKLRRGMLTTEEAELITDKILEMQDRSLIALLLKDGAGGLGLGMGIQEQRRRYLQLKQKGENRSESENKEFKRLGKLFE